MLLTAAAEAGCSLGCLGCCAAVSFFTTQKEKKVEKKLVFMMSFLSGTGLTDGLWMDMRDYCCIVAGQNERRNKKQNKRTGVKTMKEKLGDR